MEQRISPGQLINLSIRRQYLKKYGIETEQLTKYIDEEIASDDLSARQIARMRDTEDFPSTKTINHLLKTVPDVSILDHRTACQRLLLDFSAIQREQIELMKSNNTKITIIAGWSLPQAFGNDNIATTLASNVKDGVSYEFIYPSFSVFPKRLQSNDINISASEKARNYLIENLNDLFLEIYNKSAELDTSDTGRITKTKNAIKRTADQVKFVSTDSENLEDQATLFWVTMPSNYVVLYNLGIEEEYDNTKRGSFLVHGQSFRDDPNEPSFESKGWVHMNKEKYKEIEEEYLDLKKKKIWTEISVSQTVIDKEMS
jgi:hypothetical protein